MDQIERSSAFVMVACPCGRALRAKLEQAGAEIRCWDCHKMVRVPIPHESQMVAKELSEGALTVIRGPGLHLVGAGAIAVTAGLAVPGYGVWCAAVLLMMAASAYGETIRRVSLGRAEELSTVGWLGSLVPRSPLKFSAGALFAVGTVWPLWWLNVGLRQSPHGTGVGWAVATSTWIFLPLLMLALYARTSSDAPLKTPRVFRLLLSHPNAILATLAVVPLTLVVVEFTLAFFFYLFGNLPFYALDFMPMPSIGGKPIIYNGIPHYNTVDFRGHPASIFEYAYLDGLRHGYSFVGSLPPSLSITTQAGMDPEVIGLTDSFYFAGRLVLVFFILLSMLAAFGIQARWLGLIASMDQRHPTAHPVQDSTPLAIGPPMDRST